MDTSTSSRFNTIKSFYLYLVSFATLMMMTFSGASIINNLLKMTIFTKADVYYNNYPAPGCDGFPQPGMPTSTPEQCEKIAERNRKNDEENRIGRRQDSLVFSISVFTVALPLFILHTRILRRQDQNAA
jgi:hypothetical protein